MQHEVLTSEHITKSWLQSFKYEPTKSTNPNMETLINPNKEEPYKPEKGWQVVHQPSLAIPSVHVHTTDAVRNYTSLHRTHEDMAEWVEQRADPQIYSNLGVYQIDELVLVAATAELTLNFSSMTDHYQVK